MELKEYQVKALEQVRKYLDKHRHWQEANRKVIAAAGRESALNVAEKAWLEVCGGMYNSRKNGLGEHYPNFCLKIPTGGGKTLLAVKTLDLIQGLHLQRRTGFVLWIMPTTQIFRQTWAALRDRDHPYRQHLDMVSAGKTRICQKGDVFTPQDVNESLVIMLLMLPSANRENKETLKVFQDSGGYGAFFPPDDDAKAHRALKERIPNLDVFNGDGFFGPQVKTSLGNVLRMLKPVIIVDEGHKAYSERAQATLDGFNPTFLVELSATPKAASNKLVDIPGSELAREEMIKLDVHVNNKVTTDWKTALNATIEKLDALQKAAQQYQGRTGVYIRPIALIQVERTGKDQRKEPWIHAEDAVDHLVKVCGIPPEEVAVKSSDRDDIEGIDLLSRECRIRYIITKQALQEGWDCPFAYVLTILTNPSSKDALTQLVGRILRQPYARKTHVQDLDECYVLCFQRKGQQLLDSIREGFQREGLGDLAGRVTLDNSLLKADYQTVGMRDRFKRFAGKIYLPVFVMKDPDEHWRKVSYEMDIVSRVDWSEADFSDLKRLQLSQYESQDVEFVFGLAENRALAVQQRAVRELEHGDMQVDAAWVSRHLLDIVPNPWVAHDIADDTLKGLLKNNTAELVAGNMVYIVQELRKRAVSERDRLAAKVFSGMAKSRKLQFLLLKDDAASRLPSEIAIKKDAPRFANKRNLPPERSLFSEMPEDEFNKYEKAVAWFLDDQERLLWWYRNLSKQDYSIQGWKKSRIFPDFVAGTRDPADDKEFDRVLVVETKGIQFRNNPDTQYKQEVFDLCNKMAKSISWDELGKDFPQRKVVFEVIFQDEWEIELNKLILK